MTHRKRLVSASLLAAALSPIALAGTAAERDFRFTYVAELRDLPDDARKIELWLPYPSDDPRQHISLVKVDSPGKAEVRKDPVYGNSMLYLRMDEPPEVPVRIAVTFDVRRREWVHRPGEGAEKPGDESRADLKRWLKADKRVPLDKRIRALSAQVTQGKKTSLEKARAIYDYTVETMRYDKSGTGWGHGDIYWACDARRGNCTDFHALFIGLARAAKIPAKFAIGFPLPEERGEGEVGGYHCWAEFYLDDYGWIPVDTSEAKKHPEKKEYFFGAHDENRVQFTIGRDLKLDPPQKGDRLNYFIYPYVEVAGEPYANVRREFHYKDLEAGAEKDRAERPAGS